MKKLNKKGFAISTLIYSILIMGILIMGMLYSTMAFRKKSTQDFTRNVEEDLITREIKNYTICKAATKLHTNDSGSVTYGTLPNGTIKAGDAFDCDVNGNNVFEEEFERFYYLAPENGEVTSTRYVLIYSSNTALFGSIVLKTTDKTSSYSAGVIENVQAAPKTAVKSLPTKDMWNNTSLLAPGKVNITDESKVVVKVPNYDYSNTLTRFPRLTEMMSVINKNTISDLTNNNSLSAYSFLFENLGTIKGYWFEEVASSSKTEGWVVDNTKKSVSKVSTGSTNYGTRPVIVVEKENVYFE